MEDFSKKEEGEEFIVGEFQVNFIDCYDPLNGETLNILEIIDCCSGDLVSAICKNRNTLVTIYPNSRNDMVDKKT